MYIQKNALCKVAQSKLEVTKRKKSKKQKGKTNYKEKDN